MTGPRTDDGLTPHDLEAVRLCLRGESVLDLSSLRVEDPLDARRLLRLNGLDEDDPFDGARLLHLHGEALRYVRAQMLHGRRLPAEVARPARIADLLRVASRRGGFPRTAMMAGAVLKLMHLIDHVEARALQRQLAMPDGELRGAVEQRMGIAERHLRARGIDVVSLDGGRKRRDATLTKLLTRRDAAATILDRLRFRLVTGHRDELVPALACLLREVLPFNHVLARESANNLVDLDEWLAERPELGVGLAGAAGARRRPTRDRINRFSADAFRMANFVVELPVRADRLGALAGHPFTPELGRVVHATVELQLVDRDTAEANATGAAAHDRYKRRQRAAAHRRLRRGGRMRGGAGVARHRQR